MRCLYFDCFSGAAGDMIVGALLDAGADEKEVRDALATLELPAWSLDLQRVKKGAIAAACAEVSVDEGEHAPRSYRDIVELLQDAPLPRGTRERSLETFRILAEAEATVHGTAVDDVHFHEVGSIDAIVDVVAAAAALESLAPEIVVTSPIATGRGIAQSMHGPIPVPAPAVVEILKGATLYERGTEELVTPTGAAILASATSRFGPLPPMRLQGRGYGAGKRDLDIPNVLRVLIGDINDQRGTAAPQHVLIETNIDDMTPEVMPYVIERLIAAGADDAWTTPILMKKGRSASMLSVLASSELIDALLDVLYAETTTFGVRLREVTRDELAREWKTAHVEEHTVRVKIARRDDAITTAAPEYEDALKVARITGLPLKEVYRRALLDVELD